jgi:sialic acid synthase SpsE
MTPDQELQIVAELHPQFGGDMGVLREMVRTARYYGANVVKVQLYDARALLDERWSYLELSRSQFETLRTWCDQERIELMASVFDQNRLEWCRDLDLPRYKIASRTLRDDPGLCDAILSEGKETLVSLGFWDAPALPFADHPRVRHLYCKSRYPALWEDMADFPSDFRAQGLAGYSDHTLGLDFCYLAIAFGARIIEKHFTLDKTRNRDTERAHVCSMTPEELGELRRIGGSLSRTRIALD